MNYIYQYLKPSSLQNTNLHFVFKNQFSTQLLFNTPIEPEEENTITCVKGGVRGVMVIVVGNGHGDTSSNPGRD